MKTGIEVVVNILEAALHSDVTGSVRFIVQAEFGMKVEINMNSIPTMHREIDFQAAGSYLPVKAALIKLCKKLGFWKRVLRWLKTLNPARKRVGRWTVEEDKRLKVALLLFRAKTWQKIAQFILGRTQAQCRERWVNCLDPSLNLKEWTEEEDCQLKADIEEYGHCWSKVAAFVP